MRTNERLDSLEMQCAMNHSGKNTTSAQRPAPGWIISIRPASRLKMPEISAIVGAKPVCSSVLT